MAGQQFPTARESPRLFSRASGAMLNAEKINEHLARILSQLTNEPVLTIGTPDVNEIQEMLDETAEQQTQSHQLLVKINEALLNTSVVFGLNFRYIPT